MGERAGGDKEGESDAEHLKFCVAGSHSPASSPPDLLAPLGAHELMDSFHGADRRTALHCSLVEPRYSISEETEKCHVVSLGASQGNSMTATFEAVTDACLGHSPTNSKSEPALKPKAHEDFESNHVLTATKEQNLKSSNFGRVFSYGVNGLHTDIDSLGGCSATLCGVTTETPNSLGSRHYTSFQDLLIGFTTGALSISTDLGGHRAQVVPCGERFVSVGRRNIPVGNQLLGDGVGKLDSELTVGFEEPTVLTDKGVVNATTIAENSSSDETTSYATTEAYNDYTETGTESENQMGEFCSEKEIDLNNVDWEKFYSTGQLSTADGSNEAIEAASQGKENKEPWKKRRRGEIDPKRKQCREPQGMGPVERAMRQFCEKKEGHIFQPRVGLEFDSEGEAIQFYNLYSWEVGFGVRKGNSDYNKSGYITSRDVVCQRQGYDKRSKKKTKRCHCKAMIRLHRTEDDGWFISTFIQDHNHELSATDEQKREWTSHGVIDAGTRDMIKNLRDSNVALSRVHCIMGSMYGSMNNIPFTRRSLKTICAQIAREQVDNDIKKTLELFRLMRSDDPGFQFSVDLDENDQIKTLLWANGRSRTNYCCFGDVVTFDTTYCTNLYKMPFGLFVGVNNHFQSTIFGGVLMRDETSQSFEWVFKEFLTLMGGAQPQTILTDQCKAMEIALKIVMPGTTHLWCRWHVFRHARKELGPIFRDNCSFKDEFYRVITEMYTVDEFTHAWNTLLEKYKLQSHHYMVNAYEKRFRWAKCYNRGTFCARMTSTQRSESANNMLKTVVPRNSSINKFVSNLDKLLYRMYADEERAEHETKQEVRVNKRLWDVQKHAMKIYTSKVYEMFSDEMDKIHNYGVPKTAANNIFTVCHTNAEFVEKYRRAEFRITSINNGERYECECGLFEHFGLLCCHILRVFIHIGVSEIPEAHIMQRWTRKARDLLPHSVIVKCTGSSEKSAKLYLQTQIYGKALEVARKGNYNFETCEIVMRYLQEAERKVDEFMQSKLDQGKGSQVLSSGSDDEDKADYPSSNNENICANIYGASGSCAGMSDEELMNMKAPPRVKKQGALPRKRFVCFLDKIDKKSKAKHARNDSMRNGVQKRTKPASLIKAKATSTKLTPHCTLCKKPGHNRTKCPNTTTLTDDEWSS